MESLTEFASWCNQNSCKFSFEYDSGQFTLWVHLIHQGIIEGLCYAKGLDLHKVLEDAAQAAHKHLEGIDKDKLTEKAAQLRALATKELNATTQVKQTKPLFSLEDLGL